MRNNQREAIELKIESDGEFWMSFEDFTKNYEQIQICHLSANSYSSELRDNKKMHEWKWSAYIGIH